MVMLWRAVKISVGICLDPLVGGIVFLLAEAYERGLLARAGAGTGAGAEVTIGAGGLWTGVGVDCGHAGHCLKLAG